MFVSASNVVQRRGRHRAPADAGGGSPTYGDAEFSVFVHAVLGHLKEVQNCPPMLGRGFKRRSIALWATRAKDRARFLLRF